MKNSFYAMTIVGSFVLIIFAMLAGCKGTFTRPVASVPTPVPTNTPCAFCTPTSTFTLVPTRTFTPTFTPTPNTTVTVPLGLYAVASYTQSVIDTGFGFSVSLTSTLVTISINHNIEDTATMSLTTPLDGSIPITWLQDVNFGAYWVSQYSSSAQFNYSPNSTYTFDMTCSLGTAHAVMNAPGSISFGASGASVTAVYPGNYDAAVVSRISPSPVTTYSNTPGVSVGSPFVYPGSAYSSPSLPATFGTTYAAAMTVTTFTGTGSAVGAFVGTQLLSKQFTR